MTKYIKSTIEITLPVEQHQVIKETIFKCGCGSKINQKNKYKHLYSKKHLNFQEEQELRYYH